MFGFSTHDHLSHLYLHDIRNELRSGKIDSVDRMALALAASGQFPAEEIADKAQNICGALAMQKAMSRPNVIRWLESVFKETGLNIMVVDVQEEDSSSYAAHRQRKETAPLAINLAGKPIELIKQILLDLPTEDLVGGCWFGIPVLIMDNYRHYEDLRQCANMDTFDVDWLTAGHAPLPERIDPNTVQHAPTLAAMGLQKLLRQRIEGVLCVQISKVTEGRLEVYSNDPDIVGHYAYQAMIADNRWDAVKRLWDGYEVWFVDLVSRAASGLVDADIARRVEAVAANEAAQAERHRLRLERMQARKELQDDLLKLRRGESLAPQPSEKKKWRLFG